jgi:uncharacterized protein (DUF302 family)
MRYGTSVTIEAPYEDVVPQVRAALQEQGFGVLTEIDVKATLHAKLGAQMEDYVILGACNPVLAHAALEVERDLGLLLPCNVVVRADGPGRTKVQVLDPAMMVMLPGKEELRPIAAEAGQRLDAVLQALTGVSSAAALASRSEPVGAVAGA